MSESPPPKDNETPIGTSFKSSNHFGSLRSWTSKWSYATRSSATITPTGYKRPIPFDHVFFTALDQKIKFDPEEKSLLEPTPSSLSSPAMIDPRLSHDPDQAIHHPSALRLVVPHPPLAPWEDIPPYQRSRAYDDQPAYTDDYDDFLWLPRDPLSTLDLDDTIEMRLSLTTSAGGSGRISNWPEQYLEEDENTQLGDGDGDGGGDGGAGTGGNGYYEETGQVHGGDGEYLEQVSTPLVIAGLPPTSPTSEREMSPNANSERRLLEEDILSPLIGSEVEGSEGNPMRHSLRHVAFALTAFTRPRPSSAGNLASATSGGGRGGEASLRTISSSGTGSGSVSAVSGSIDMANNTRPPLVTSRTESGQSVFLLPRVSTPRPISIRHDSRSTTLEEPPRTASAGIDEFGAGISPKTVLIPQSTALRNRASSSLSFAPPPATAGVAGTGTSHTSSSLGRSPSGRRPLSGRTRATSRASATSQGARVGGAAGGSAILRSASIISRGRSSSNMSSGQMALLNEVMEEEKRASKSAKEEVKEELKKEEAELKKEKERMRKAAGTEGVSASSGRRPTSSAGATPGGGIEMGELGRGRSTSQGTSQSRFVGSGTENSSGSRAAIGVASGSRLRGASGRSTGSSGLGSVTFAGDATQTPVQGQARELIDR